MALAIGRTGLHRRLALAIVGRAPASPRALLLAFMVATAMLSMIVSNTATTRSEEHTSELQSLMRISYAVFCLKKKKDKYQHIITTTNTKNQDKNYQTQNN